MPYFETRVIASSLILINMISFLIQIFKEDKSHKFLIISNLFLTAYFLGTYTFFKREALLHIGGAFYIIWLIFAFVLDLSINWKEVPIEKWFSKKETSEKKEKIHFKIKKIDDKNIKKETQNKKDKQKELAAFEEEKIKKNSKENPKEDLDEDFENYDLNQTAEVEIEEDDFEIQEVGSKEKLPYKLFTKKGTTTLHREDCRTLKKAKIKDLVEIHDLKEAESYDLTKCKICKPGE